MIDPLDPERARDHVLGIPLVSSDHRCDPARQRHTVRVEKEQQAAAGKRHCAVASGSGPERLGTFQEADLRKMAEHPRPITPADDRLQRNPGGQLLAFQGG